MIIVSIVYSYHVLTGIYVIDLKECNYSLSSDMFLSQDIYNDHSHRNDMRSELSWDIVFIRRNKTASLSVVVLWLYNSTIDQILFLKNDVIRAMLYRW